MRARAALLLLLVSCFPDADKLRSKTSTTTPPTGTGGTIVIGTGGAAGGTGGAEGGTGGGPAVNRTQLCNELAAASAAKASECAPFVQVWRFGSAQAHASRIRLNCNLYDLPNVRFPPAPFKPCADALAAQPCEDWIDGISPPACLGPGLIPEGEICASGFQCETDLCDLQANGCGKCAPLPTAGEPCYRGVCAPGHECNPAGTCVSPSLEGEPCDAGTPCVPSLACQGGKCVPLGAPGAACTGNGECDIYNGAVCGAMNTKCVPVTTGPMCTVRPDGTYVFCATGGNCQSDGTCVPAAADGGSCSMGQDGPDCVWPAQCLSDLKCHLFQANRTCGGKAAVRPIAPGPGLLPAEGGVRAFWRSLVVPGPLP